MPPKKPKAFLAFVAPIIYLGIQIISSLAVSIFYIADYLGKNMTLDPEKLTSYLLFETPLTLIATFISTLLTVAVLILLGDRIYSRSNGEKERTSLKTQGRLSLWEGVCLFCVGVFMVYLVNIVITKTPLWTIYESTSDSISNMLSGPFALSFITLAIITPIAEEIVFRAGLYRGLRRLLPVWVAILISSAVFGILHGNLVQAAYTCILGVIICIAYEKYSTVWAGILIHSGFNFVSSLNAGLDSFSQSASDIANYAYIAMSVIGFIYLGFLLFKSDFPRGNTFRRDSSGGVAEYYDE